MTTSRHSSNPSSHGTPSRSSGGHRAQPAEELAATYDTKYAIRSVAPVLGNPHKHLFLVGTNSLRDDNEIHFIEYHDDTNDISCERLFPHPSEIWHIAPHPSKMDTFFTVSNKEGKFNASLWTAQGLHEDLVTSLTSPLELLVDVPAVEGTLKCIQFEGENTIYAADGRSIRSFKLDEAGRTLKEGTKVSPDETKLLNTISVDRNKSQHIAAAVDTDIQLWDFRSGKMAAIVNGAHDVAVRDVQFNPMALNNFVSGGDDCLVKFWDRRKLATPVFASQTFPGHSHWVWTVRYNPSHDQFVLSAGSDTSVKLWNATSVSSAISDPDEAAVARDKDGLIRSFDHHEESVYSIAWTASIDEPYMFCAASYDGRVSINHVPASERQKIYSS